ncbi:type II toxin-antitoxin system PemK/MazF family toxin [Peribacillus frigoritolerans]|uniref:type II toxin-antitoxin system PemK/MazF family toxin n=1 Tax=Peribacillus frigoritolerans TaxID=450367 RepID=UPI0021AAA93B|nr:type II toxin-antitoxin system PemK/MazF family toxin [Peribacillus frigoritolerans]MCT4477071.1 type II toxin-antitoxin system PemK/MazF family toxin [Peribacillus frigoritolerans]
MSFTTDLEKHLFNVGDWVSTKMKYHLYADKYKHKAMNIGEIWKCDLGHNVADEKNKARPVVVVSNNKINQSGKVIILSITDAKGKINPKNKLPWKQSWFLMYANTTNPDNMFEPGRRIRNHRSVYNFLNKDSVLQCEEIRLVSKSRFDFSSGTPLGTIDPEDFKIIKNKMKKVFDI